MTKEAKRAIKIIVVTSIVVLTFIIVLFLGLYSEQTDEMKPTDNNCDEVYLTYVEGHPELTMIFIDYRGNKYANVAYNVGTRVIYSVSKNGAICPLYTSDGKLMLYQEDNGAIAVTK